MSSTRSSKRRSAGSSKAPTSPWDAFGHPTDRYARRVLGDASAGDPISAGPLVRMACARHLRDRQEGGIRGLTFDEARATHAIEFYPKFLPLPDGLHAAEPFDLQPHQQFIIGSVAGWLGSDGELRYTTIYDEEGKGSGKTPVWAGYGLYRLVTSQTASQIYLAAVTADQSKIMLRDCERFVESSPLLRQKIQRTVGNLSVAGSGSFLRTVSSEHRSLDGKRVSLALIDELHEQPTGLVADKMRAGTKGQQNAQIVECTNAGFDRASVCWQHHEFSRAVLEDTIQNDSWFAYVCALDEGDDPLSDETCWIKANPNLGVSITQKYLRDQVAEANGMPTKANIVLRLNFCVWTTAESRAIDLRQWEACPPFPSDAELATAPYRVVAFDLGLSDDFTAMVTAWPLPDGRVAVRPRFWLPSGALEKYPQRPYDAWRRLGVLDVIDGEVLDLDVIERAVLAECRAVGAKEVAYDKRFASQLAQHLTNAGLTTIDTRQGFDLNEALTRLLELIVAGKLCHPRHPILTWMASNTVVRHGRLDDGAIRLDKESARDKIDGISALVMALDRIVRAPAPAEPQYQLLIIGGRR